MSAKILLARKLRNETRAHSILVGDTGFYWRDLPAEEYADALLGWLAEQGYAWPEPTVRAVARRIGISRKSSSEPIAK